METAYGGGERETRERKSSSSSGRSWSGDMMALDNCFLFSHQPSSFDWDPHSFGEMESPVSSEASTGYLQDAVAGWSDPCKRRRIASSPHDPAVATATNDLHDLLHGFWDSGSYEDPLENLNYFVGQNDHIISDGPLCSFVPLMWYSTQEDTPPQLQPECLSSSSFQGKDIHERRDSKNSSPFSPLIKDLPLKEREMVRHESKKKKKVMGVVYPFVVVKPGGFEGDVTLADINERILMRPTRPVRHPVGEFACGPCITADGTGLSGKMVVGLTRIQTKGRGTITIVKTRG